MRSEPLLEIDGLSVNLGHAAVVRELSLQLAHGEMLGLVGESGCGKSVTALSILDLFADSPLRITGGAIRFNGRDLRTLDPKALQALRGNDIAMIFQEPMTSLNPVFRIGDQIAEVLQLHKGASLREGRKSAIGLLQRVGMASPASMSKRYPHELSGGQRQRVMIAMALACKPKLLIADEPTTPLDVTVQAQILELLNDLRLATGMSVLLITHDLGLVRQYCDRLAVMYLGRIVETGDVATIMNHPQHPYTQALISAIPGLSAQQESRIVLRGELPDPANPPPGCAFSTRCPKVHDICIRERPSLIERLPTPGSAHNAQHFSACHLTGKFQ